MEHAVSVTLIALCSSFEQEGRRRTKAFMRSGALSVAVGKESDSEKLSFLTSPFPVPSPSDMAGGLARRGALTRRGAPPGKARFEQATCSICLAKVPRDTIYVPRR
eukprot:6196239-Pleurochrysis_carterae.AAC.3